MKVEDFIIPLVKKWWLILAAVVIAIGASYVATAKQPFTYQSHTTLMVGRSIDTPNPTGTDMFTTQQLANTYADFAKREPVRKAVMEKLGLTWLPDYVASVVPNTQLIEIRVTDTSPQRAQAVTSELADQLILLSPAGSNDLDQARQDFVAQQLDELEQGIKQTNDDINKKQAELAGMFSARQIADTQTLISALQAKLSSLQANYASLLQNTQRGATNIVRVIEPADLPAVPTGPNRKATILLAAAIAFSIAAAAAYLLTYLDDTLKTADDVQRHLGLASLGLVPFVKEPFSESVGMPEDGPAREAYNILRTNLQFASVAVDLHSLLITSAIPGEGKSLTSANLAIALAQSDRRVILVDGDLRRPQLHHLFKLPNTAGVTGALLAKNVDPAEFLQDTEVPGLRVLTSGPIPPNPAALLSSPRAHELFAALTSYADIVVLDSPPAVAFADAAILSKQVDGVLLVVKVGRTSRSLVARAVQALNRIEAPLLGVVLNCMQLEESDYRYQYQYSQKTENKSRFARARRRTAETN